MHHSLMLNYMAPANIILFRGDTTVEKAPLETGSPSKHALCPVLQQSPQVDNQDTVTCHAANSDPASPINGIPDIAKKVSVRYICILASEYIPESVIPMSTEGKVPLMCSPEKSATTVPLEVICTVRFTVLIWS